MSSMAERAGKSVGGAASSFINSPFATRFGQWGLQGVKESGMRGAAFSLGFADINAGARAEAIKAAGTGGFRGLGRSHAAHLKASRSVKAKYKFMPKGHRLWGGVALGFGALAAYEGYQEQGVWGAGKAVASQTASFALFEVGMSALKTTFQGTGMGGVIAGISKVAMHPLTLMGVAAGYGAYKGAEYLAERGRKAKKTEFVGDTSAFNTQQAYTMRQRSLGEMNRGYGNARTLLGQEASIMHV